jgi:enoyl-CoA hydratase/carnithine racemase
MGQLHSLKTINTSLDSSIFTITLNNPDLRNRLATEDVEYLLKMIEEINSDLSVRALVLTGTGSVFCSGFNLKELTPQEQSQGTGVETIARSQFERLTDELECLRCPSICALNGPVYGGAIDLALACDFRVATPDLKLSMPASRIGLHYYPNGISRYVSRLGVAISKKLFLLGGSISGDEIQATGFIDFLTSMEEFEETVAALSQRLASGAPLAIEGMKRAINFYAKHAEPDERLLNDYWAALTSDDFRNGLAMTLEKKPVTFARK